MTETWISAVIEDENGEKGYYQFDSEDELRYFLAINDTCTLLHAERCEN